MSTIDDALEANQGYAKAFHESSLKMPPAKKLAVVACMDARLTIEPMLGLKTGDAHIIRNAGGIVTEDTLRSLIISQHLLATEEVIIINHTDCGMLTFKDGDLRDRLLKETGTIPVAPEAFHAFDNVEENVRRQMLKVKVHPWIARNIGVRGFVYDVHTGKLTEVAAARTLTA